jgi:hypothetical protein
MIGPDTSTALLPTVGETHSGNGKLLGLLRRALYLATSGCCSVPLWHGMVPVVA